MHSTGTEDAEADRCRWASLHRTGYRPRLSLRCQNWSTSSQAGVLMSDLTAKPNISCILSAANFYQNSADIRISRTFCGGFSAASIIAADMANFRRLRGLPSANAIQNFEL